MENSHLGEEVLADVAKVPGWTGRQIEVHPLSGGITNRNYRVDVDGESFVLRKCAEDARILGIDRDRECACSRIAAELGVGAEVVRYLPEAGIVVFRFIDGTAISPDEARRPETLARIVRSIKAVHRGPDFPDTFSPFQTVRDYHEIALARRVRFPEQVPRALELMGEIESALQRVRIDRPCHNDLLAANFLDDGDRIRILDWEYAAMGDPFFDLGNFAVNQELDDDEILLLLEDYAGEARATDTAHVHLMKLASDLRESFWGFLQSGVSQLDFDYLDYGRKHLERFLSAAESPRLASWIGDVTAAR